MPEQKEAAVDDKVLLYEFRTAIMMAKLSGQKEMVFPIGLAERVELMIRPICGELDT